MVKLMIYEDEEEEEEEVVEAHHVRDASGSAKPVPIRTSPPKTWDDWFAELKVYHEKYGHTNVSKYCDKEYKPLYGWLQKQKNRFHTADWIVNRDARERFRLLTELGVSFRELHCSAMLKALKKSERDAMAKRHSIVSPGTQHSPLVSNQASSSRYSISNPDTSAMDILIIKNALQKPLPPAYYSMPTTMSRGYIPERVSMMPEQVSTMSNRTLRPDQSTQTSRLQMPERFSTMATQMSRSGSDQFMPSPEFYMMPEERDFMPRRVSTTMAASFGTDQSMPTTTMTNRMQSQRPDQFMPPSRLHVPPESHVSTLANEMSSVSPDQYTTNLGYRGVLDYSRVNTSSTSASGDTSPAAAAPFSSLQMPEMSSIAMMPAPSTMSWDIDRDFFCCSQYRQPECFKRNVKISALCALSKFGL